MTPLTLTCWLFSQAKRVSASLAVVCKEGCYCEAVRWQSLARTRCLFGWAAVSKPWTDYRPVSQWPRPLAARPDCKCSSVSDRCTRIVGFALQNSAFLPWTPKWGSRLVGAVVARIPYRIQRTAHPNWSFAPDTSFLALEERELHWSDCQ